MKAHTVIQRVFKRKWDNTYQEFIVHMLHFEDFLGNKTIKQDKVIEGGIWKEARDGEVAVMGEAKFFDPEQNRELRLILVKRSANA
jgi:hypothetical protein